MHGGHIDEAASSPGFIRKTLAQLLAAWATHDLTHLAQVTRVLAKRWRDAIGPWRVLQPLVDQ
jgi:hypothetical protein